MLDACRNPDLVTELTVQPVRRHGVDAAILFSDIVLPLKAAGVDVDIVAGVGPVIGEPVRSEADVSRIALIDPSDLDFVAQAVGNLIAELGAIPLIGFAGAPFTLASYLIEGGPSRDHARTKALMYSDSRLWNSLLDRIAEVSLAFLQVQIDHGAAAVQLFDSWAGTLSEMDYRRYVLPHTAKVLSSLSHTGVPRIHFGVGTSHLLRPMAEVSADVVGVDWRTPLNVATSVIGSERAIQGNLDPATLLADWPTIEKEVHRVLADGRATPGHIFNLGHGVLPHTSPEILTRVVELVHASSVE